MKRNIVLTTDSGMCPNKEYNPIVIPDQIICDNGKCYADDGNGNYTATAWVDDAGNNLTGTQVGVGQAFWIKSATAGKFTFGL